MIIDPQALFSIELSLKVASVSTALILLTGLPLSYFMATRNFHLKGTVDALLTLPLVFPPTVTGYILLLLLGKNGLLGELIYRVFKSGIIFTWYGAVVASFIAAFPIFYKTARNSFEEIDRNLIFASYTLGKGEIETFLKVALPLAKGGVVAGAVLSFARALGEFGATLMVAGNIPFKTNTIPIEIYNSVSSGNFERANVLTLIVAVISVAILITVNRLISGRRSVKV